MSKDQQIQQAKILLAAKDQQLKQLIWSSQKQQPTFIGCCNARSAGLQLLHRALRMDQLVSGLDETVLSRLAHESWESCRWSASFLLGIFLNMLTSCVCAACKGSAAL